MIPSHASGARALEKRLPIQVNPDAGKQRPRLEVTVYAVTKLAMEVESVDLLLAVQSLQSV